MKWVKEVEREGIVTGEGGGEGVRQWGGVGKRGEERGVVDVEEVET